MKDIKNFDLLKITGLSKAPKKPSKYATFNQRMMALTIDSFIILIIFASVIDAQVRQYFPMLPIDTHELQQKIGEHSTPIHTLQVFLEEAYRAGILARWVANSVVQAFFYSIMCAVCWHYWSATPGKILLRLRIADAETDAPITNRQIALRLAGYVLSTMCFFFGFLNVAWNKERQGWHDKLAGTVVLVKPVPWRKLFFFWKKDKAKPISPIGNQ